MPSPARSYNLRAVQLIIGEANITGYGDDGAVEVEFMAPFTGHVVGQDGEVAVHVDNDATARVRVQVLQTSRANRLLWAIWKAHDEAAKNGDALPNTGFFLLDPSRGDTLKDRQCYIQSIPGPSVSKQAGTRTWEFLLPNGRDGWESQADVT